MDFSLKTALTLGLVMLGGLQALEAAGPSRTIPKPLASHPGNVFLAGESVVIKAPAGAGPGEWRALDYEGKSAASGPVQEGQARLGKLAVGYYEVLWPGAGESNRAFVGVLEPLQAPTPLSSPIDIDVAMAWFFPKEHMEEPASLCALAGINRVRDRLTWGELEPKRGEFAAQTRYDASARLQTEQGLQILQVNHSSAGWANSNSMHFPGDLRDTYNFHREMAQRWRGQVGAFEPWNEADIKEFGGHTGSEMASLQKAAYLGLKAGNPDVIGCLNVFAIHRAATLQEFDANQAWPYFDTFNLHHYEGLQAYPKLYKDFREVSAGKPLWVSECSVRVKWSGSETARELSGPDLRAQSERLTKTYALALHQGAAAVFYFMLPHYTEGALQYGLLHADLSPRPGFVALAAVGRLLADAKALGRLPLTNKTGQAYFFDAKPDGRRADVVVVWAQEETTLDLPQPPQACFDHLGRPCPVSGKSLKVGPAPLYAIMAPEARPKLVAPPAPAKLLGGEACPVVLQALLPQQNIVMERSAYTLPLGQSKTVPIFVYNFSDKKVQGKLSLKAPAGWKASLAAEAQLAAGERKELALELSGSIAAPGKEGMVLITGDFGSGGKPVLAVRFLQADK